MKFYLPNYKTPTIYLLQILKRKVNLVFQETEQNPFTASLVAMF